MGIILRSQSRVPVSVVTQPHSTFAGGPRGPKRSTEDRRDSLGHSSISTVFFCEIDELLLFGFKHGSGCGLEHVFSIYWEWYTPMPTDLHIVQRVWMGWNRRPGFKKCSTRFRYLQMFKIVQPYLVCCLSGWLALALGWVASNLPFGWFIAHRNMVT